MLEKFGGLMVFPRTFIKMIQERYGRKWRLITIKILLQFIKDKAIWERPAFAANKLEY